MTDFWQRLKQRKLVQWAIAYVAFAFALIQVIDVVADSYDWPHLVMHLVFGVLVVGFVVMLLLAWYHGERGAQRISGPELLLIALALAIGGGLLWHFGRAGSSTTTAKVAAVAHTSANPLVAGSSGAMASASSMSSVAATSKSPASVIAAQPIPAKSIAVLPFENLSADKNNEYFVAGMQGMILTKLGDVGELKVIARTSTAGYGSRPEDTQAIGRQLGVATLLEGSVQKVGNQVLIEIRLVKASSGDQIWAQNYQRSLSNVFGVEGEVAEKVAQALNARLTAAENAAVAHVPTTNMAAYDLFLRADYQAHRGSITFDPTHLEAAIPLYRQAIAKDPGFALAYAHLSLTESRLVGSGGGGEDRGQLARQARVDAEQALQLAPNLPEAELALGLNDAVEGNHAGALKHTNAALSLRPNDVRALIMRGNLERGDAAIASLKQAVELDPRNAGAANGLGALYMFADRYSEAENWFRRALALDPDSFGARYNLAKAILYDTGDVGQALRVAQGDAPSIKLMRVSLLTLQRKNTAAIALLESIPDTFHGVSFFHIPKVLRLARLYLLGGDRARAGALSKQALPQVHARLARTRANDPEAWQNLALAELGLGHTTAALHAIGKVRALVAKLFPGRPISPHGMERNAGLYAQAKRPDLAVPLLAKALAAPGIGFTYSPVMLWLDPVWDPIRDDARFQALLKKYAKYKPAVIYPAPPPSSAALPTSTAANGVGHD